MGEGEVDSLLTAYAGKRSKRNDITQGENWKCFGCGELGHRARECPNKSKLKCKACGDSRHTEE